ncbi:hypothetical protein KDU71_03475 [Carboxylicivirga sediminis]|uniref:DUF3108 domain-containing protein n=1 Tax=Carboxylicivirga sediminis TaxID=2006564 RepID=A0A941F1C6_9BACT|nr:hypothetical protein [Carboxylicivirga sediminis]MBR8534607.1 hypothetical protein [Carboxylicivirga sediminis]
MKYIIGILLLCQVSNLTAQECRAYIPYEEGTRSELTHYDKKGKVTGLVKQELKAVEHNGNASSFTVHQVFETPGSKDEPMESEVTFKCVDGVFYIDMNGYLNQEQMDAYKDMEVKLTMDEIDIPSSYKVGQTLKDGNIRMEVTGTPIPMNMTVSVVNRKVEAEEEVKTPAGTFNCVKISQDIVTKAIMNMTVSSVEWYAEGVGVVRTESHRKGKLMGYSELTKFEKP